MRARDLVSRNVRRTRELRQLSQADLGRALGWPKQRVSALEAGERDVKADDLVSLAVALQVAPAVLLTPWEDDEALDLVFRGGARTVELGTEAAYGWLVGAPPPEALALIANPVDYFTTTPAAIQRRYGREWLKRVRESLGWEVSDDGTHIRAGDFEVIQGRGER
jgi:transcriptional regulator with XRE-family HTH domain